MAGSRHLHQAQPGKAVAPGTQTGERSRRTGGRRGRHKQDGLKLDVALGLREDRRRRR